MKLLTDSLTSAVAKGRVFRHRISGGELPIAQRKQAEASLQEWWGGERDRFLNPSPDFLRVTLANIHRDKAKGVAVVPLWSETQATARLRRMASAFRVLSPRKSCPLVSGPRDGTERCKLLLAEMKLPAAEIQGSAFLESATDTLSGDLKGNGKRDKASKENFLGRLRF